MYNLVDLKDKTIFVTGASSGIGKATVQLLDKLEAKVIMVARDEDKLKNVLDSLNNAKSCYYSFDLNNLDNIESFVKKVIEDNGPVDGLVHSAGIDGTRPLKMMKPEDLQKVMNVNTYSFIELVRSLTKKNRYVEGCSIVGISSAASMQGNKSEVAYCASKGALDAAVRAMAKELAPKKIRVNTINPAYIKTELVDGIISMVGNNSSFESRLERQYLGVIEPENVANLVAFILSQASAFITGSSVAIDGGRLSS